MTSPDGRFSSGSSAVDELHHSAWWKEPGSHVEDLEGNFDKEVGKRSDSTASGTTSQELIDRTDDWFGGRFTLE
jgi:hypothetical protein